MRAKLQLLCSIFYTFFKISPVTFGGGYAMLSLIELEVVRKYKWIKEEEIPDIFTVSQSIPGAVAINSAIFVGYQVAGWLGAIVALLGILLPAFLVVTIISFSYYLFYEHAMVKAAFNGIGAAVIALIIYAGYKMAKTSVFDLPTWIIAVVSIILLFLFSVNPIFVIFGGFVIGVIISKLRINHESKKQNSQNNVRKRDTI